MYFYEKIFPLADNKILAVSLFEENLIHLFPAKDTYCQGYAYIMNVHTQEKENIASLCTRIVLPDQKKVAEHILAAKHVHSKSEQEKYKLYAEIEKETGVTYPIDALVAPNGLVILTFRQDYQYLFRMVDLEKKKILSEETADIRGNKWMALNEAGTYGVRKCNANLAAQPDWNMESLRESIAQGNLNMTALTQAFSAPKQPDIRMQIVSLPESMVVAELEDNPLTRHVISYRDQWLLFRKDSQSQKNVLVQYNAHGKKQKEYAIKSQHEVFSLNINHQKGLCMIQLGNGEVVIINLVHDMQQSIRPHKGLVSSHSVMDGVLNDAGTQLATLASTNEVMLTQLDIEKPISTLITTFSTPPVPLALDGKYSSLMRPGLAWINDDLYLLTAGQTLALNINSPVRRQQEEICMIQFDVNDDIPSPQKLNEIAIQSGLGRVVDQLVEYYTPMIICETLPNVTNNQTGASHFGGNPDLTEITLWPKWQKRPMQFIGQFNLAHIAIKVPGTDLPKTGLLSLFIAVDEEGMMIYPGEDIKGDEWKVLYQKDLTGLKTITQYSFEYPIAFCALDFQALHRLPEDDSILIETLQLTNKEMDAYQQLAAFINKNDETYETENSNARNALRGHPATFQGNDLELQCEMCHQLGSFYEYPQDTALLNQLKNNAKDFRLLFQLMDDEHIELGLGEFYYFFFITKEDLQAEHFDRIWFNGQC